MWFWWERVKTFRPPTGRALGEGGGFSSHSLTTVGVCLLTLGHSFLQVTCRVTAGAMLAAVLCLGTSKSVGLSGTWSGCFVHTWFCTVRRWPFGEYWLTEACRPCRRCRTSSHGIRLGAFPPSCQKLYAQSGRQVLQNSEFGLSAQILLLATHSIDCFP